MMRHTKNSPFVTEKNEWVAIHEVYYRNDDVDDLTVSSAEIGCTMNPIQATAYNIDDLRWRLEEMLKALDKPVLEYDDEEENKKFE
ncbi:MAG: hypothetical protein K1Y36_22640 [Blastocatellia bacterium]|nr:hypothetical protein [Blastocatellia bacterium]